MLKYRLNFSTTASLILAKAEVSPYFQGGTLGEIDIGEAIKVRWIDYAKAVTLYKKDPSDATLALADEKYGLYADFVREHDGRPEPPIH